ncbi:MAG: hypothetical protein ACKO22_13520 [Cyanobium sp.]
MVYRFKFHERLIHGGSAAAAASADGHWFRVYDLQKGTTLIILLAARGKSSQAKDIDEALQLADNLPEQT